MTFTALIKDEIVRELPSKPCCARAFLQAVARCAGSLVLGYGGLGLSVSLGYIEPLEWLQTELEGEGLSPLLSHSVPVGGALDKRGSYTLSFSGEGAQDSLERLRIIRRHGAGFALSDEISVRRECCRRAYLAGAFISCGSAAKPDAGYHMEFALRSEGFAASLQKLMERMGLRAKTALRRREHVVYLKESDSIERALILIGAPGATLKLDVERVEKDVRNRVNREVNCERANIGRTVSAAQRCVEAIALLRETGELEKMPAQLRELACLREAYAEDSLAELGQRLTKSVSKSGVAHRLRRIEELARKLEGGQPEENPTG